LSEEEKDCTDFLQDGMCPRHRWATEDCPLNVVEDGYRLCCMPKED